jgi:ectoine hydroxylase-related dioxygenase (phytanoyl-CoA dioxygenase family)
LSDADRQRYRRLAARAASDVEEQGFTCIPDLFSPSELRAAEWLLLSLFGRFEDLASADSGFSDWAFDSAKKAQGRQRVTQPEILNATSIEPQLRETAVFRKLCEFAAEFGFNRFCFDHAMLKPPGSAARTPWHQDAQYVDEEFKGRPVQHPGYRFWVPFQDTTEANGCMEYVPGSHRDGLVQHDDYRRGGPRPGWEARLSDGRPGVSCPVPKGGVAIHTPLTLHGAGANTSTRPRLAWILNFDRIGLVQAAGQGLASRLKRRWQRASEDAGVSERCNPIAGTQKQE